MDAASADPVSGVANASFGLNLSLTSFAAAQTPEGNADELDAAELRSVKLFQDNTPSVVNISNISASLNTIT